MTGSLEELKLQALECTRCALAENRTHVVFGEGSSDAGVMVIGEGPGEAEDLSGHPFVGRSGKLLVAIIQQEMGLAREQIYIANTVKCRPPANRNPTEGEVEACSTYLNSQIELIDPDVIITVGAISTRALLRRSDPISKLRGSVYRYGGRPLVPTYHPAAALRGGGKILAAMRADLALAKLTVAGAV
ncbi:MAG: uracil-DNA glycosylase [Acidimicrobiaceae bacterium]|nr:uracil-DNA glycosylase [Acidimicrobiaceae bacterium]